MKFLHMLFTHNCIHVHVHVHWALCEQETWQHQTTPMTGRVVGMAMWLRRLHLLPSLNDLVKFNFGHV